MGNIVQTKILEKLTDLKIAISEEAANLDDKSFGEMILSFHEVFDNLKDIVFDKRNGEARKDFEEGWGAQSVQFVIDCIPEIHRIMHKHYSRVDELSLLDVGAGSGIGSNVFTTLHSGRHVYSKINVDAIDYIDSRLRWVKTMYPKVNYNIADVYELPEKNWDLVFCSHVIEHVPNPRIFLEKLIKTCKGFLFIYAPYNETNRIPAHINTITESLFDGLAVENINIMKSMAWHADIPEDMCILVVIDCI
jgi:2-polyprenyl-3-methyl-5-hydroxy-6-metoxy-1,4-benzoquinol methylase